MIIDPSILQEPSTPEKALFRDALHALQLAPFIHEKHLTTPYPTSHRLSKDRNETPSGPVSPDRALALMKNKEKQAAGKRIL